MFKRLYSIMTRFSRIVLILIVTFYSFLAVVVALHWGLNVCPFHFKTFKQPIPVVYGLPTFEMLLQASSGEIILGGCMVHSLSALCPYCHWPVDFKFTRNYKDEPADNAQQKSE